VKEFQNNLKFLHLTKATTANTLYNALELLIRSDIQQQKRHSPFWSHYNSASSVKAIRQMKAVPIEEDYIPEAKDSKHRQQKGTVRPSEENLNAIISTGRK